MIGGVEPLVPGRCDTWWPIEEVTGACQEAGHPLSRARVTPPGDGDLAALAERAAYHPSAEHKDRYLPGTGVRRLRTDATACPQDVTREQAQAWLGAALVQGHVGGRWDDQPFPQYAWYRVAGTVFEARLTNAEQGWFKGYPLRPGEEPTWLP